MAAGVDCATAVARALDQLGVRTVFTVSGNQILGLMDALDRTGIALVHCRHETGAAYMAEAAARVRGRPAVVLVTAGPGFTSMLTGLLNAAASEASVLVLAGGAPAGSAGVAFQQLDQAAAAAPIAPSSRATGGAEAVRMIRAAWSGVRRGVPGPACVSLPVDVLRETVPDGCPDDPAEDAAHVAAPAAGDVDRVVASIASATSPLVLARPSLGHPGSRDALAALRERVRCLVVESPRGLSDPAWAGEPDPLRDTDTVVVLGPVDFALRLGEPLLGRRVLQVTSRPEELAAARRLLPDVDGVLADERATVTALATRLGDVLPLRDPRPPAPVRSPDHDLPLHPLEICEALRPGLRDDDVLVVDGGEFGQWMRAGLADRLDQQVVNGKLGAIGGAIPHAVGASLACPGRRVFAFTGDGAFGYYSAELETAVRMGARVTVVVGNDACWGAERHSQVRLFGADRVVATDLSRCDHARVARGYGAAGFSVRTRAELGSALAANLAAEGPYVGCVDVAIRSAPSPAAGAV